MSLSSRQFETQPNLKVNLTKCCLSLKIMFVMFCCQQPFLLGDLDRKIARYLLHRAYSSAMSPYGPSGGSSNGTHEDEDTPVQCIYTLLTFAIFGCSVENNSFNPLSPSLHGYHTTRLSAIVCVIFLVMRHHAAVPIIGEDCMLCLPLFILSQQAASEY